MRITLCHGFNVSNPRASLGPLGEALTDRGHEIRYLDYGWVGPFRARASVQRVVDQLLDASPEVVIAHSHGNVVTHEATRQGLSLKAHIAYQPAMRRDFVWPEGIDRILVLYNPHDWAVRAGKVFRFINPVSWFWPHPWGTAGAHGFTGQDERMTQWDVSAYSSAKGHGYLSEPRHARNWGDRISWWLTDHQNRAE